MHNVQIAIPDRTYAQGLHDLLVADGQHQVYVVDFPSPAIDGVVVVDDAMTNRLTLSGGFDFDRCVVFTRTVPIEVNRLWEAGVRHVIQADYPPHVGRLVVLAAERRLSGEVVIEPEPSIFNESDISFLHALKISDSLKATLTKPVVGVQLHSRFSETLPSGSEVEVSQSSPRGWVVISWNGLRLSVLYEDLIYACSEDDARRISFARGLNR